MSKKGVSIRIKLSAFVLFIVLVCSAGIGLYSYFEFKTNSVEDKKETAMMLAQSFASSVDGDRMEEIVTAQKQNDYWYQLKEMADRIKAGTDVMYLYVIDTYDNVNESRYFLEGYKPDEEQVTDFLTTDTPDNFGAEMYDTLKDGISRASDAYDAGDYGSMVSGYAAIKNSAGKVVGVVGTDIDVSVAFAGSDMFAKKIFLFVAAFCVIFFATGVIFLNKMIISPIKRLSAASRKMAAGDISVNIGVRSRDEIGRLSEDLIILTQNLTALTERINETTQAHGNGNIHTLIPLDGFSGAYRQVADGINNMSGQYVRDMSSVLAVIRAFGKGDFTAYLEDMPGEKRAVNDAVEELRRNLENINGEVMSLVRHAESGQLSARIDSGQFDGDWKQLTLSLNSLLAAFVKPVEEASSVLEKIGKGVLNAHMDGQYEGDFEKIKTSINSMADSISGYISEIETVLDKAARNDLSADITGNFVGRFGGIKLSVNRIMEHLREVFGALSKNLRESSQGIMSESSNLADSSLMLSNASSSQAETIEMLNEKIQSIGVKIEGMAQNAGASNELSSQSQNSANEGKLHMQILLEAMNDMSASSKNILTIISAINAISYQTNLLAINASVEAARAGKNGKGFAVVAEEVRNLAERSKKAAMNSSELINISIGKVEDGVKMAMETNAALHKIADDFESLHQHISEITNSSEEQRLNIIDIGNGIESLRSSALESAATSEEVSAIAAGLLKDSERLTGLILKLS